MSDSFSTLYTTFGCDRRRSGRFRVGVNHYPPRWACGPLWLMWGVPYQSTHCTMMRAWVRHFLA